MAGLFGGVVDDINSGVNSALKSTSSFINNYLTPDTTQSTTTYQAPDPYAQWGGQTNYNNLVNGYNTQKQGIYGSSMDAARDGGAGLRGGILDFFESAKSTQRGIDSKAARNILAKNQGVNGVLGMVGRGIKSGGVMLANKNAGDSSAAGALAGAYGDMGRRQLANVGNQYEMGNEEINLAQTDLDTQKASFVNRKYGEGKEKVVNGIVNSARQRLAELDAAMTESDLPGRIAIDQEKEAIRQQVLGELQQYDQLLSQQNASVNPTSMDQRREYAQQLGSRGTDLGADSFQYSTETPAQFQNTGPYASSLPIFTTNKRRIA